MNKILITQKLHRIAFREDLGSLECEIATQAVNTDDPVGYLQEMYRDKGIMYDLDEQFLINYIEDIVAVIENHDRDINLKVDAKNYTVQLSYMAIQITMQNMMISFDMLEEKDRVF